jgi:hypothetical protein
MKYRGLVICPQAERENGKTKESDTPILNLAVIRPDMMGSYRITLHYHIIIFSKTRQEKGVWLNTPHEPPDGPLEYILDAYAELAAMHRQRGRQPR